MQNTKTQRRKTTFVIASRGQQWGQNTNYSSHPTPVSKCFDPFKARSTPTEVSTFGPKICVFIAMAIFWRRGRWQRVPASVVRKQVLVIVSVIRVAAFVAAWAQRCSAWSAGPDHAKWLRFILVDDRLKTPCWPSCFKKTSRLFTIETKKRILCKKMW